MNEKQIDDVYQYLKARAKEHESKKFEFYDYLSMIEKVDNNPFVVRFVDWYNSLIDDYKEVCYEEVKKKIKSGDIRFKDDIEKPSFFKKLFGG